MTPVSVDVCIVGGGLTGLAAACALRKAGLSVVLIERRSEPGDANRGDWLPPRAVELLKEWGVSFDRRPTIEIRAVRVNLGSKTVAVRKLTSPGLSIPFVHLESALRETAKAAGVDLRLGWQLQGLTFTADHSQVIGVTALGGADYGVFNAKLVVGADGRASIVRDALGLKLRSAEKTSELLACEADLASISPTLPDSIIFSVGSRGGGLLTPLSTRRVRVVATTSIGEADALSRLSPMQLSVELPTRSPLPLGAAIDPSRMRTYDQTASGHLPNYTAAGAVCIGDAAHPPPAPFAGIMMSLLDIEALVRLVPPALKNGDRSVEKALSKLEIERWPNNEKRLNRGRAALNWLSPLSGAKAFFLRTPLAPLSASSLLDAD